MSESNVITPNPLSSFMTLSSFSITVPHNHNKSGKALEFFRRTHGKDFKNWDTRVNDANFPNMSGLHPGTCFKGMVLGIAPDSTISLNMCSIISSRLKAVNTGAQGLSLVFRHLTKQHINELVGKTIISMLAIEQLPEIENEKRIPAIVLRGTKEFEWTAISYSRMQLDSNYALMLLVPSSPS